MEFYQVKMPIRIVAIAVVAAAILYVAICALTQKAGLVKDPRTILDPRWPTQ